LFLAKVHQLWRGEKSGVDGLPDSHRIFGDGSVSMADGKGEKNIVREAAGIITFTQLRKARSRRCHIREKRRRLREMGIDLSAIRCFILET